MAQGEDVPPSILQPHTRRAPGMAVKGMSRRLEVFCLQHYVNIAGPRYIKSLLEEPPAPVVGGGAHGDCYLTDIGWVVKVVARQTTTAVSVRNEVRTLTALSGVPGVQKLVMVCPDNFSLVTEYAGTNLDEYMRTTSMTMREGIEVVHQVCTTLSHMHERGLVHMDIKAHNVCVRHTKAGLVATVIDFGSSARVGDVPRYVPGTVGSHVDPSVAQGCPVSPRADVFSVAQLMHYMVAHGVALPYYPLAWTTRAGSPDPHERPSGLRSLLDITYYHLYL